MTNDFSPSAFDAGTRALIRDADGAAYAVPVTVLEARRLTPTERAALEARARELAGSDPAPAAPLPAEGDLYTLTPADLAPYRLSDEERAALDAPAADDDAEVQGFQYIGQFPGWVAVAPGPINVFQRVWQRHVLGDAGTGTLLDASADRMSERRPPYPGLR